MSASDDADKQAGSPAQEIDPMTGRDGDAKSSTSGSDAGLARSIEEAVRVDGASADVHAACFSPAPLSEDAAAKLFADRHHEDWRYVRGLGGWFLWDGRTWVRDQTDKHCEIIRGLCREVSAMAEHANLARKLGQASTMAGIERLARSDQRIAATPDIFDRDPWLLNTSGGIVDLRTGTCEPHRRDAFCTKITRANPVAGAPVWMDFLVRITGEDADLIGFLQRACGYALVGDPVEHALFFLYGPGGNGKSVFLKVLSEILGDYAKNAAAEVLLENRFERHSTELASLAGARLVTASETGAGRNWDEVKLKVLTGGDAITARFMREDNFTFRPQFTFFVAGNHRPSIRVVDEAMRRRIHLLPFTVPIPAEERDPNLAARLLGERDGILAWMIAGAIEWHEKGLSPPPAVTNATSDYLADEDTLGTWIGERCVVRSGLTGGSKDLYDNYRIWTEERGERVLSQKRFSGLLQARGFAKHRRSQRQTFIGIDLRLASEQSDAGDDADV